MDLIMKKKKKKALIIPKADSGTHSSKDATASDQSLELGAVANSLLVSRAVVFKGTKASNPQPEKTLESSSLVPWGSPVTSQGTKSKLHQGRSSWELGFLPTLKKVWA